MATLVLFCHQMDHTWPKWGLLRRHRARAGNEIILDNQGVVKATPPKRKGVVKDQDYRDIGYHSVTTQTVDGAVDPDTGHRELAEAATYKDYQGHNKSDTLANMGDNLPMETPPPKPHDIVLHIQIMPTLVKSWIMQLRRQKLTTEVH